MVLLQLFVLLTISFTEFCCPLGFINLAKGFLSEETVSLYFKYSVLIAGRLSLS